MTHDEALAAFQAQDIAGRIAWMKQALGPDRRHEQPVGLDRCRHCMHAIPQRPAPSIPAEKWCSVEEYEAMSFDERLAYLQGLGTGEEP